ncbi:MAG: SGNH/GDSL hydrolase family protein [Deltaproteobacteria bacterium]|nr:SGNH/GDSL hydrolase family protein [Candidatus Anaeroferrophillacea bacterium]
MLTAATIVFFGDSITNGFGVRRPWRRLVTERLERSGDAVERSVSLRGVNAGIDGDTLGGGLLRLRRDVLRHEPCLVTVAFGLNDAGIGVSGGRFAAQLADLADRLGAAGVRMLLLTTVRPAAPEIFWTVSPEVMNAAVRKLAADRGLPLVDLWTAWPMVAEQSAALFLADGVHPGAAGHAFIADRAAPVLADEIAALRRQP